MSATSCGKTGRKDEQLLLALVCGASVEVAASKAGMSRATAFRRLKTPQFQAELKNQRQDMLQRTIGKITALSGEAVKNLHQLMGPNHSSTARLGACKAILELGCKLRDHDEFEQRLRTLEQRYEQADHPFS